jgi:hypothetical protein
MTTYYYRLLLIALLSVPAKLKLACTQIAESKSPGPLRVTSHQFQLPGLKTGSTG